MTNEEVLKVLEAMVNCDTTPNCEDCYMHLKDCTPKRVIGDCGRIFLEALKKRIPEQVYLEGDGEWDGRIVFDTAKCSCGKKYEDGDDDWECNYCPNCGQRLKWFE